ncbi:MAG: amidohydrolase [Deltaproteobacteria bacterium]|nr:amidohydrolase [Deltaproteobacteria bacterium]MBI3386661.1 amidohydrolase [Deltaproteobacteria bacterium]
MRVVDADAHIIEGRELMAELMQRFPDKISFAESMEDGSALVIEGRRYPQATGPGAGCRAEEGMCLDRGANPFTPEGVLKDADIEGIEQMVFFPSAALGLPAFTDQTFAAEVARRYNHWLAQYCQHNPQRLFGVALVPIESIAESIAIMREAKQLGLVATMIPAVLRTRNLDHPDLEPFYSAAADLAMPLGIHGAPGIHLPNLGSHRFDNYLQVHCVSFPFDMMVASTALILGGVLERHPKLRVALLESGVGWVPYFMERMHEHLEKRGRLTPACKHRPEEYIARGQIYVSCEPEEASVPLAVETLGANFIMYASDYPHWDGDFPNSTKPLRQRTDITPAVKARIMGENARTLYGLPA